MLIDLRELLSGSQDEKSYKADIAGCCFRCTDLLSAKVCISYRFDYFCLCYTNNSY